MKAYLLQVLVMDDNYLGLDEVVRVFEEDTDYRDSIEPHVISTQSIEVEGDLVQTEDIAKFFSDWQPIETAPQNTSILVWSAERGTELVSALFFRKPLPTHWIPLPNPPEARC